MPKRTSDYHVGLRERLKDPQVAASYLRSAMEESRDLFFIALRNVAQARQMASVAKKSKLNRESLYKMLSSAGNPTYDSLNSVLRTIGLRLTVEPLSFGFSLSGPSQPTRSLKRIVGTAVIYKPGHALWYSAAQRTGKMGSLTTRTQLALNFGGFLSETPVASASSRGWDISALENPPIVFDRKVISQHPEFNQFIQGRMLHAQTQEFQASDRI